MKGVDKRLARLKGNKTSIRSGVLICPWGDLRPSRACHWANGDPFDPAEPYEGILLVPGELEPEEWERIVMEQQAALMGKERT